jgi:hypothetical protein
MTRKTKSLEERLWGLIDKKAENECWPWLGGTVPKGYGTIKVLIDGKWKTSYAHREILKLSKGVPITPRTHALHSCDNPRCCNPQHLHWGTNSKNRREARDRLHNQGNQKLTPQQVDVIRNDSRTYQEIANDYFLHRDTIARIKQKRGWLP